MIFKMFDPQSAGRIEAKDVEVLHVLPGRPGKWQHFEAIVTLQGNRHKMFFKANPGGKRDQLVADRLKHMFGLQPMHTVMCALDFGYQQDERVELDAWLEYFMFANLVPIEGHLGDVDFESQSDDFKLEVYKIIMFRFILGLLKTQDDHILIRNGMPISISEMIITSGLPSREFVNKYINESTSIALLQRAQLELADKFDNDNLRGVILQTRKVERTMFGLKPKGPLNLKASRIAVIIEERVDLITTCDPSKIGMILVCT